MARKKEDRDTRYYLDLDLRSRAILGWDYGQRHLLSQLLPDPLHHRVFLTKGQYNKLEKKNLDARRSRKGRDQEDSQARVHNS
jgi:hypothetical protein